MKKRVMRNIFLSILFGAVGAIAYAQKTESGQLQIRIGTESGFKPYEYKDAKGKLTGIDVDLGDAICAELKAQCVWVDMPFDELIPAVKEGKIDVIMAALSVTPERKEHIIFSTRLHESGSALIAPKKNKMTLSPASLKGKKIGVQEASSNQTYAEETWVPAGAEVVTFKTQEQVYENLINGKVDAVMADAVEAEYTLLRTPNGPNYSFVGGTVLLDQKLDGGSAAGFAKTNTKLRDQFNDAFDRIKRKGRLGPMYRKYVSYDIRPK